MNTHLDRDGLSRAFLHVVRSESSAAGIGIPANPVTEPEPLAGSTFAPSEPRCFVCGGPSANGAGCEFCPKVFDKRGRKHG